MNRIKSYVLQMDFSKFFKWFLIAALAVFFISGVAAGISLRAQIGEAMSHVRTIEENGKLSAVHGEYCENAHDSYHDEEGEFGEGLVISEPSGAGEIMLGIFGGCCLLIFAVYWLAVALWLYQAAVFSGMNGLLWLLAGLCANLAAVLLFLLVRSFIRKKCPACGHFQSAQNHHCVECGTTLYQACGTCGYECKFGDRYCPNCGEELSGEKKQ